MHKYLDMSYTVKFTPIIVENAHGECQFLSCQVLH